MLEYIKSDKAKKNALESLDEKECENSMFKKCLEKRKYFIDDVHLDLTNKYEIIQMKF